MAVTIKDVASLAGVSPSTVSRVCNDNPSISKETRERVRKAMAQLGYELNPASAAAQESRAIRMVGIILPACQRETYDNSFYLEAIRGISKYCNMHGAASMIITGRDDQEVLLALENVRASGQADGFILMYSKKNDPVVEYLVEHQMHLLHRLGTKQQPAEADDMECEDDAQQTHHRVHITPRLAGFGYYVQPRLMQCEGHSV